MPSSADRRRVGVLGATSLVGGGLLPLLIENGWQVAAFSRHASVAAILPNIAWWKPGNDLPDGEHIHCWVSLAPIRVLPLYYDWLLRSGAKQIVALSSTSRFTKVDSSDPTERALAQGLAESEMRLSEWAESHGIAWTILRPTLIYGEGRDKNLSQIARLIRRFGFFPLLGEARGLRQPIHLQDLAATCVAALELPVASNRAFNLSGAESLTYREMVRRVFAAMGRRPFFVRAPLSLFRFAVATMRLMPRFRNWSPAMAERMNRDMVFDHSEAERELGFTPRAFILRAEDLPQ